MARKGKQLEVFFTLLTLDGTPVPPGNILSFLTPAGQIQRPTTNAPTLRGNHQYSLVLTEEETNHDSLGVVILHEDELAVPVNITIITDRIEEQTEMIADAGGTQITLTIRDKDNTPLPNVTVWLTLEPDNPNKAIKGQRVTDDFGKVSFMVTPGTYYMWRRAADYQFDNPQELVVTE